MNDIIILILISLSTLYLVKLISNKYDLLLYIPNNSHKDVFKNKIYNIGGLILFLNIILIFFIFSENFHLNLYNLFFIFFVFLIGVISDIKEFDAKLRLIFLSVIVFFFVFSNNLVILDLQFTIINNFFSNYIFFSFLFASLCIIILINGINFIDGVHGLSIFYSITIIILLNIFLYRIDPINYFPNQSIFLIPILFILFIENIREKIFFGDSGSYLIGCLLAVFIISQTKEALTSYPYVYANMLIYPAFEVLFSIIRKFLNKQNPLKADKRHLHHLIQNIFLLKNVSLKNSKILSGLLINFSIIIFNLFAIYFFKEKIILIFNIFFFVIFYSLVYLLLSKKLKI